MTNINNIPPYLKDNGLFCLWKYEDRDGRRTKVPYNPKAPKYGAKSNDRSTFSDLKTAAAHADGFDGLGIGIFDAIAGIDIDHCVKDGLVTEMAADIVETMGAYTEVSPSGEGLRILFLAPGFSYDPQQYYIKRSDIGLEVYIPGMTNRYLTVTGDTIRFDDLEDRSDRLQVILDRYMKRPQQTAAATPASPLTLSDAELIEKAKAAKNGGQFAALWDGDIMAYPSQSEADQALCNLLAFWTGKDAARIDDLFRQSGLMRDKWDRRQSGTTYGAITIQKAISSCREVYTPPQERTQGTQKAAQPVEYTETPETQQEAAQPQKTATELFDDFMLKILSVAYRPMKTGMQDFDRLLGGGILPQSLVILSAAPGTGKTTLAQQIFETMAAAGNDVLFFNLEMSREQLLARSLSRILHRSGHNMTAADVLKGFAWTDIQKVNIEDAAAEYRQKIAPWMNYNPEGCTANIQDIANTLDAAGRKAQEAGRPAPVVVLDYLHLVTTDTRDDPGEIIKKAVSVLKSYAVKYNTFVLAISANNRTANSSGVISLDSGRDTSAIEYTADYQLSLNYKALHERSDITFKNKDGNIVTEKINASNPDHMEALQRGNANGHREMLVQVLKNRLNPAGGKLYLNFDAANSVFYPVVKLYPGFYELPDSEPVPFV